ncbi:unnamed protein product [Clonostachys byssicola]|uniref:Uncharacterized protein n=1 Tax=Clonostachys byssicola TaxID=160290 RepID=A0A9N9UPC2_9HYPO|nr:unnamed protein product [Clonostachys byssicola]
MPTLPDSTVTSKIEPDQKNNRKLRSSTRIALQDVTNRSPFDRQPLTGESRPTSGIKPRSRKRTFADINGTEEFEPCDEENITIDESAGKVIKAIKRGTKTIGSRVTRPVDSEILDNAFMWINDDGEEIIQRHRGGSDYQGLMARTLPDVVVEKHIKAPKRFAALDDNDEDPFAFVYSHEKLVVHPERLEFKAQVLAAHTQRGNRTLWDLGVTIKGVRRTLFRIQRELFSRHEITLILSKMMDAVVRWPTLNELFGNPNRNTTLATILFSTAQQSVLPEKPMLCGGYTIGKQVFLSILIRLPFIDRDTLKVATTEVTITPKAIKEECDEVESTLFTFNQGITWDGPNENGEFPFILKRGVSEADDASREGFDRAQRLARLCRGTWARKSPLSTKAQLNAWYRGFIDQYHEELRVYDGSCLILTNAQILLTQLHPSPKICEHISGQSLPFVQIYSMDRSWVDLVMDKAISTWMQTSDLIKT